MLVRARNQEIAGIVTASDLSMQFRDLTEPFLLLSEIENLIRNLIGGKFTNEDLLDAQKVKPGADGAKPKNEPIKIADLDLGDYVALLQNLNRWVKFKVPLDRVVFCDKLNSVRVIRNKVMHFDTDGTSPEDLKSLRAFTNLLKQIEIIMNSEAAKEHSV